jgi:membrane-associated phospholipid phosphatase
VDSGRQASTPVSGTVGDPVARMPPSRIVPERRHARLSQVAGASILILGSFGATMSMIDASTFTEAHRLPVALVGIFYEITDFGKSGWLLLPLLALLVVGIAAYARARPRFVKLVLCTVVVRVGFLFAAIGVPGLFTSIVKVIVGRARPSITAGNPFVFHPFTLHAQDMSLPSGHSTTAFAAAMAIRAVWPRIGMAVWVYALVVGASRVVVTAHFPSDVMASAIIGIVGSLLVRNYFADRRLVFSVRTDGKIRALPGPSFQRLRKAVCSLLIARRPTVVIKAPDLCMT